VKVLFRQNASWQGSIAWLEGKREESFRSVLELLLLIDSAVSATDQGSESHLCSAGEISDSVSKEKRGAV